jgi:hypothetical protein
MSIFVSGVLGFLVYWGWARDCGDPTTGNVFVNPSESTQNSFEIEKKSTFQRASIEFQKPIFEGLGSPFNVVEVGHQYLGEPNRWGLS